MPDMPGARRYRIRVFDGDYELLAHRLFMAVLDLDTGPGLRQAEAELTAILPQLARRARIPDDQAGNLRLEVHDWTTDERVFDWFNR